MKEIKFLKDLAIRLTNQNKPINVEGGDIYYDADGNRFGYVTFKNTNKSPIFSLQLFVREYNADGVFIRDNELFDAYCYYPSGAFVINNPIPLDKETEAIDITIVKLTFNNRNFINDRYLAFKDSDYADLYQKKAPVKKPGTGTTFTFSNATAPFRPSVIDESAPEVREEPVKPVQGESATPTSETVKATPSEATSDEAVLEEIAATADAAASATTPASEETQLPEGANYSYGKESKDFFRYIPVAIAVVLLVVMAFVIMTTVTRGVNVFNENYTY